MLADWLTDCDADRLMLCERGRLAPLTETICEIVWLRDLDCDFDCDSDFDVDMDFDWLKLCESDMDFDNSCDAERVLLTDCDLLWLMLRCIDKRDTLIDLLLLRDTDRDSDMPGALSLTLRLCDLLRLVLPDCVTDLLNDAERDRLTDPMPVVPHTLIRYVTWFAPGSSCNRSPVPAVTVYPSMGLCSIINPDGPMTTSSVASPIQSSKANAATAPPTFRTSPVPVFRFSIAIVLTPTSSTVSPNGSMSEPDRSRSSGVARDRKSVV